MPAPAHSAPLHESEIILAYVRTRGQVTSMRRWSKHHANGRKTWAIVSRRDGRSIEWAAPLLNGAIIVSSPKNDYRSRSSSICEGSNCGSFLRITNVLQGIQIGVDPSVPQSYIAIASEGNSNSRGSQEALNMKWTRTFSLEVSTERYAVGTTAPVRFVEFHPMPAFARPRD
jgi:hypothetical protein